jgi:hypothetical protein
MADETIPKSQKPSEAVVKPTPIGRLSLAEVDAAISESEKSIKSCSDTVKAKLNGNAAIPTKVLHELSRANAHRGKLMMRRITLLIDGGDAAVMELLDKLMKVKPAKAV